MANKKTVFLILHCRTASYLIQNYENMTDCCYRKFTLCKKTCVRSILVGYDCGTCLVFSFIKQILRCNFKSACLFYYSDAYFV